MATAATQERTVMRFEHDNLQSALAEGAGDDWKLQSLTKT